MPFDIGVDVPIGSNLLDAVKSANLPLRATCGGKGTCGDCVVRVLSGGYHFKPSAALSGQLASQGYALACQTEIKESVTVELPQFRELSIKSIVDSKFFEEKKDEISGTYELNPVIKKISLHLPAPALEDHTNLIKSIEHQLKKRLSVKKVKVDPSLLQKLADAAGQNQGKINVVVFLGEDGATVIDAVPLSEDRAIYGLACDIGTTTVALHLVDLQNGKIAATTTSLNQQITCGEDIISRIVYSQKPGRLKKLHELIVFTVNNLIDKAVKAARIPHENIYFGSFSGNTTMIHLFLSLDPQHIRKDPSISAFKQVPFLLARDLGLKMHPEARIHCAPAVGSYVGGDITAGLLCTPLLKDSKRVSLFIDAGTNGELVVGNKDWLVTCACSAGPAFEGSGIKCGMPASEGAIEKIEIQEGGKLEYTTINGAKPKGVCGSGLVDLLAELFTHGYVDRSGKFDVCRAKKRIVETEAGKAFLVETGKKSYWGKDLVITENDIKNLIRTKGAVYSACSLLLKHIGLPFSEIASVYIAGGFGQSLNVENAVRIGLLPDIPREQFHYIGNSSLLGAYLILLSDKNMDMADETADKMTYIELNTEPDYMNEYTGALFLPHTDIKLFPSVKQILKI
jgi:uncharacterized 2Fe-2S/4Fe-4S cluster protein (DUF4445 family)